MIELDIFSDTVCPWCYIGKKRLEKLLQLFNGPKEISESSPKIIHSKTGIPIKIATEIIKTSKKNIL